MDPLTQKIHDTLERGAAVAQDWETGERYKDYSAEFRQEHAAAARAGGGGGIQCPRRSVAAAEQEVCHNSQRRRPGQMVLV